MGDISAHWIHAVNNYFQLTADPLFWNHGGMTDSEIIDAFGGTSRVAELCEVYPSAVSQWRDDGIPRARLMYLKLLRPDIFAPQQEPAQDAAA
jgi:hypothetical protein